MMNVRSIIDSFFGTNYRLVEETFDLKWANRYNFEFSKSVNEAVVQTLAADEKGGVIVFSTDVNAKAGNGVVNFAKAWVRSLVNRFTRLNKVQKAVNDVGVSGFSLGNFFRGHYKSQSGQVYDERSLALEVLFVTKDQLIKLGTALAREFNQEAVLVKSSATGEIYFVDGA